MYSKNQNKNRVQGVEATIILDMVEIIQRKSKHIDERLIKIFNDKKQLVRLINNPINKEATYAQEGRAEVTRIK